MIQVIVETFSSEMDRNGNRYHFAVFTSTKDRQIRLSTMIDGPSNARHYAENALGDWEKIYWCEITFPKRQWQAISRKCPYLDRDAIESWIKENCIF